MNNVHVLGNSFTNNKYLYRYFKLYSNIFGMYILYIYLEEHSERKTESDREETEKGREFNRETFWFWCA